MPKVVALQAVDAVAVDVNLRAAVHAASDAIALNEIVKLCQVATHTVDMSWVPEHTASRVGGVDIVHLSLDLHG